MPGTGIALQGSLYVEFYDVNGGSPPKLFTGWFGPCSYLWVSSAHFKFWILKSPVSNWKKNSSQN